ncbi:glucosyltransferase [Coemansia aciculifera]|uniref:Dol-P-Glc:Glc(2)Man(9)GlcNAc(2)-PP-Dol alpha-1,2-glucosyltransferase n=1 Tax=Coemansia aciculifera TaxID=417176 RepID=A0A9W8IJG8_9FUNG|nr:glucosyltransferase [Coemansia aciculifera]
MAQCQRSVPLGVLTVFVAYASISYGVLQRVNAEVPLPYMDEVFHIPQAQHYCRGQFGVWDPKLTTPPGLYLISMVPAYALSIGPNPCSPEFLRTTNWALSLLLFWTIYSLIKQLRPGLSAVAVSATVLSLSLFPVSFFLHHMYYTDTASLLLVLISYSLSLGHRHVVAGIAGFFSLWLRQTNVIWIAFIGASAALRQIQQRAHIVRPSDSLLSSISQICKWAARLDRDLLETALLLTPYALVAVCFAMFVHVNKGIVLGDKSNHEPVLHIPQIFYFCGYVVGASAPTILPLASPKWFVRQCTAKPARNLVFGLALSIAIAICIQQYTIEHPFLLSDNRHYPFYVWKNIFRRHWTIRYALIPLYVYAVAAINRCLCKDMTALWRLALALCTAAVLIPSPLLEFRYFSVPYFFVRLHIPSRSTTRTVLLEALWFSAINAATIWVFINRPFAWPSEPGQLQRFMW